MSTIKFLPEESIDPDFLSPIKANVDKNSKPGIPKNLGIDPFANAHEKPALRILLIQGEDYKNEVKPIVDSWMKNIGEFDEWMIIHFLFKENSLFHKSVISSLKSDIKSKFERYEL